MGMWPFSGGSGRGGVAQNDAEGRAPHAASEFADEGADADLVAGYEGRLYVHPPPSQGYLPSQSRTSTSRSSSQQPVASTSGSSSSSSSDTENGDPRVSGHPALPMAEVGAANRKAQMRGTMDGIAGFVLSSACRLAVGRAAMAMTMTMVDARDGTASEAELTWTMRDCTCFSLSLYAFSALVTRKALRWTPDSAIWTGMGESWHSVAGQTKEHSRS